MGSYHIRFVFTGAYCLNHSLCVFVVLYVSVFCFQAVDGIQAKHGTGFQTGALPIYSDSAISLALHFPLNALICASEGWGREATSSISPLGEKERPPPWPSMGKGQGLPSSKLMVWLISFIAKT